MVIVLPDKECGKNASLQIDQRNDIGGLLEFARGECDLCVNPRRKDKAEGAQASPKENGEQTVAPEVTMGGLCPGE
jgi:hypothetical protein